MLKIDGTEVSDPRYQKVVRSRVYWRRREYFIGPEVFHVLTIITVGTVCSSGYIRPAGYDADRGRLNKYVYHLKQLCPGLSFSAGKNRPDAPGAGYRLDLSPRDIHLNHRVLANHSDNRISWIFQQGKFEQLAANDGRLLRQSLMPLNDRVRAEMITGQ